MINYFDVHSHLNFPQYDKDRGEVIERMIKEGVWTITVGTSAKTSKEAVELSEKHDHLFATIGVHPTDSEEVFDATYYSNLAVQKRVVAVGECGLDYFRLHEYEQNVESKKIKKQQRELFEQQIEFALKHKMPLMLHCRPSKGSMDAYKDVLGVLRSTRYSGRAESHPGNVHFFVGDVPVAKQFLELGFSLSFDGPITFAREYDEVIQYTPLDMLMVETDAPFAPPLPYRGKRNEPSYVTEVVKAVASIRGEDLEVIREATVANAFRTFHL